MQMFPCTDMIEPQNVSTQRLWMSNFAHYWSEDAVLHSEAGHSPASPHISLHAT